MLTYATHTYPPSPPPQSPHTQLEATDAKLTAAQQTQASSRSRLEALTKEHDQLAEELVREREETQRLTQEKGRIEQAKGEEVGWVGLGWVGLEVLVGAWVGPSPKDHVERGVRIPGAAKVGLTIPGLSLAIHTPNKTHRTQLEALGELTAGYQAMRMATNKAGGGGGGGGGASFSSKPK
jgi:hypothetical protein